MDKYHLQAHMELEDQRKDVKIKIETFREELRKKQAAEEKKANKKWLNLTIIISNQFHF